MEGSERILIVGKRGCQKCDAAKEKCELLGVSYQFIDLGNNIDWRTNGSVAAIAAVAFAKLDPDKIPYFIIQGEAYDYSRAMSLLRKKNSRPGT